MWGNQQLPHDPADCSTCAAAQGNEKQWVFPHHTKTRAHTLHLTDGENLAINRGFAAKFALLPGKSWVKTWEEVIYGYEQGHFKVIPMIGEGYGESGTKLRIESGGARMSHPDISDFPPEAITSIFGNFCKRSAEVGKELPAIEEMVARVNGLVEPATAEMLASTAKDAFDQAKKEPEQPT